jgi:hypothetical protein
MQRSQVRRGSMTASAGAAFVKISASSELASGARASFKIRIASLASRRLSSRLALPMAPRRLRRHGCQQIRRCPVAEIRGLKSFRCREKFLQPLVENFSGSWPADDPQRLSQICQLLQSRSSHSRNQRGPDARILHEIGQLERKPLATARRKPGQHGLQAPGVIRLDRPHCSARFPAASRDLLEVLPGLVGCSLFAEDQGGELRGASLPRRIFVVVQENAVSPLKRALGHFLPPGVTVYGFCDAVELEEQRLGSSERRPGPRRERQARSCRGRGAFSSRGSRRRSAFRPSCSRESAGVCICHSAASVARSRGRLARPSRTAFAASRKPG